MTNSYKWGATRGGQPSPHKLAFGVELGLNSNSSRMWTFNTLLSHNESVSVFLYACIQVARFYIYLYCCFLCLQVWVIFYQWMCNSATSHSLDFISNKIFLLQVIGINSKFPGEILNVTTNWNVVVNVKNDLDEPLLLTWYHNYVLCRMIM